VCESVRSSQTHEGTQQTSLFFLSPDPEKLSKAVSATEEAMSLLLIGSVLTAKKKKEKETTVSPNQRQEKKKTLYVRYIRLSIN